MSKELKKKGITYHLIGIASVAATSWFTKDFLGGIARVFTGKWKK